jgi:CspA family cold shock protein
VRECLDILVVRGTLGMATGKVKWFNNAKGYGFILPEGGGEDLFAHYSSIEMEGYKTLKAGQDVEFEVQAGPKGMHAVHIRATESAEDDWPRDEDGAEDAESEARTAEAPFGASAVRNGA